MHKQSNLLVYFELIKINKAHFGTFYKFHVNQVHCKNTRKSPLFLLNQTYDDMVQSFWESSIMPSGIKHVPIYSQGWDIRKFCI